MTAVPFEEPLGLPGASGAAAGVIDVDAGEKAGVAENLHGKAGDRVGLS